MNFPLNHLYFPLLVIVSFLPFPCKDAEMSSNIKISLPLESPGVTSLAPSFLRQALQRIIYICWCHILGFCSSLYLLQFECHTAPQKLISSYAIQRISLALNLLHCWKFVALSLLSTVN